MHAHYGPASERTWKEEGRFEQEVQQVAPKQHPHDGAFVPGDALSQALDWAIECIAKAGALCIIGVYLPKANSFPIGKVVNTLSINMGECNHRTYVPMLLEMVRIGRIDPVNVLTQVEPITGAIEAYERFDRREAG